MNVKASQRDLWFILVLVVALAARLWHLTTWDLWTDEMHTLALAQSGVYGSYSTAPINFLLTGWAIRVFGYGELGGRIVPCVAGLTTVALVYLLGRTWVGKRAALLGSAVVALSTWHVYWSQTARHFSLETLAVLLAVHCFLLYWRQGRWIGVIGAPGFLLIALFIHASAGFYLAALGTFVVGSWLYSVFSTGPVRMWWPRGKHLVMLIALAAALAIYLPAYLTVSQLLLQAAPWNPLWNLLGSLAFYLPPVLSLAAVAGAAFLAYERNGLAALFLALLVVPIVLLTAASAYTIASSPYCLPSLPAVALLVGVACDRLLTMGHAAGRAWATVLLVCVILGAETADLAFYHTFNHGFKPRWREVAAYLRDHRAPGELVLSSEADVLRYYVGAQQQVAWYDHYERLIGTPAFPSNSVSGVWYAIYIGEHPFFDELQRARSHVFASARLERLFPLHYGAKDRTIGLFHEPLAARRMPSVR